MKLNIDYIKTLMKKKKWKPAQLAKAMKVSRGTVSRLLNGSRGGNKDTIGKLISVFPDEPIGRLFILDDVLLNSDNDQKAC